MTVRTFDSLWADYLPNRVKGLKTEAEVIRVYEVYIRPKFGKRLVTKTDFKTIEAFHKSMADRPYQANRVLSLIKTLFTYAQALEWVAPGFNPAGHVVMFPEKKRRRHMKMIEAPRIASFMKLREATAPYATLFLWLVIFTGARSGEIKAAKWGDLQDNKIVLKEHKSDQKGSERIIILPPAALKILSRYQPGKPTDKIIPLARPEYIWEKIREEAKCHDLRIHDLRHTFGTYALEKGYNLDQIGEALEHANVATTKIYAEMRHHTREKMAFDVSVGIAHDMEIRESDVDPLS